MKTKSLAVNLDGSRINNHLWIRLIAWPSGLLLVAILSWLSLDYVFLNPIEQQRLKIEEKAQVISQLDQKVKELKRQQDVFHQYNEGYQALNQAWLSPVNRVVWVDQMTEFSQKWLASGLNLKFAAKQSLQQSDVKQLMLGKPIFHHLAINLSLQVQIDTDFFRLVDSIRQEINPNIWLEQCRLRGQQISLASQLEMRPERGNITVECVFQHFYIQPAYFNESERRQ